MKRACFVETIIDKIVCNKDSGYLLTRPMISGGERGGKIQRNPMYMNVGTNEEDDDNKNSVYNLSHSGVQRQYPTRVQQDGDRRCVVIAYGILLVIVVSLLSVIAHQQAQAYLQLNRLTDDVGALADSTAVSPSSHQRPWETSHPPDRVLLLEKDQRYGSYVARIPLQLVEEKQAMLLVEQVTRGIGLHSLYWDPGNVVSQHLCRFHFLENDNSTIVLGAPSQKFRSSQSAFIQRSFSDSILWRGSVLNRDEQNVWVDVSDLFGMPPGHLAEKTLLETLSAAYGTYANVSLDASRSSLEIANLHASSALTTIAADLHATFTWSTVSSATPTELMDNVASGRLISTSVRRSLHVLSPPDDPGAYTRRPFHPKCGFNYISLMNEDASLFANRQELYVVRHRLTPPSSSGMTTSDGYSGIVYLVDAAIPDTYRAAIIDGIQWWDDAFVAAGYPQGTLRVHVAPSGFDPYDLFRSFTLPGDGQLPRTKYSRVHFVQWIDRDVRAYSLGQRIIDPRSGEILHGHVRIEGLRLRQDAMIAEALTSPYGDDGNFVNETMRQGIVDMVLQRVKHLGAHEVGHSLGLAHNFAGSSYAAATSLGQNATSSSLSSSFRFATVMDYPPPIVRLGGDGSPVVNENAYANGIGDFDKVSVQYAYGVVPHGENEASALTRWIVRAERQLGYTFETDQDSSISSADWQDTKWDINHGNVLSALNASLTIRAGAMRQLGMRSLHNGSAVSHLRALIPIVYLWHRYDVEAVGKLLGGYTIQYPLRDDYRWGSPKVQSVPFNATLQWRAVDLVRHTMHLFLTCLEVSSYSDMDTHLCS